MRRSAAVALVAASALALAGCAFGPDPREVYDRTAEVFDDLTAELGVVDAAVVRSVELVPPEQLPCGEGDETQQALVARGTLSVRAEDGAVAGVVDTLAATLDSDEWEHEGSSQGDVRAWSNADGITVTLSNASPLVVVAVFGPCLPPVATPAS